MVEATPLNGRFNMANLHTPKLTAAFVKRAPAGTNKAGKPVAKKYTDSHGTDPVSFNPPGVANGFNAW